MTNNTQTITLGMGCFWCTEAVFQRLKGVKKVTSGYMGGTLENPTYDDICNGDTGHAEVSQIEFNPEEISLEELLYVFWRVHNPTSLNKQGADVGTQYRSVIFFQDEAQKKIAEQSKKDMQKSFEEIIVTEIVNASTFYPAEDYHQNYYKNNQDYPYCRVIIDPKIKKLQQILPNTVTS